MKLLTKKILSAFKKQGDTTQKSCKNTKIITKFFNPCGAETWYAIEYDPKTKMFYGFVRIFNRCNEFGDFSLKKLKSIKLPCGLKIERDKFFEIGKYTLKEIMDGKRL